MNSEVRNNVENVEPGHTKHCAYLLDGKPCSCGWAAVERERPQAGLSVKGVTAIYVYQGRVLASASDFAKDRPGGFTLPEAQEHRARDELCREVVKALASPALYENLTTYDCRQIVQKMGGAVHVVVVGHVDEHGNPLVRP